MEEGHEAVRKSIQVCLKNIPSDEDLSDCTRDQLESILQNIRWELKAAALVLNKMPKPSSHEHRTRMERD